MSRAMMLILCGAVTLCLAAPATAGAAAEGKVAVRSKITNFSVVQGRLVANGTLTGLSLPVAQPRGRPQVSASGSCSVARGAATCSR